jgi:transcription elongation GreA/GreB family factor
MIAFTIITLIISYFLLYFLQVFQIIPKSIKTNKIKINKKIKLKNNYENKTLKEIFKVNLNMKNHISINSPIN